MHRYAGIEVIGVSTGWEHTCAVASGGGVWCFGGNNYGQLGIGNTTDRHSPSAVSLGAGGFIHSCELVIFGLLYPWMRIYSVTRAFGVSGMPSKLLHNNTQSIKV